MPGKDAMPSTVARSDDKAKRTWVETYDSAMETDGDEGGRARRVAFAALKLKKDELVDAIQKANNRKTAKSRGKK